MGTVPPKGQADFWSPGDFNAVCSMCGKKRKASTMVRNWMGLYRCPEHNDVRQPQDFARNVRDDQSVPWAQLPQGQFVVFCTMNSSSAIPDFAIPGCSIPDNSLFDPNGV